MTHEFIEIQVESGKFDHYLVHIETDENGEIISHELGVQVGQPGLFMKI